MAMSLIKCALGSENVAGVALEGGWPLAAQGRGDSCRQWRGDADLLGDVEDVDATLAESMRVEDAASKREGW